MSSDTRLQMAVFHLHPKVDVGLAVGIFCITYFGPKTADLVNGNSSVYMHKMEMIEGIQSHRKKCTSILRGIEWFEFNKKKASVVPFWNAFSNSLHPTILNKSKTNYTAFKVIVPNDFMF